MGTKSSHVRSRQLKRLIVESLTAQGFRIRGSEILPPEGLDKKTLRDLHALAVQHRVERAKDGLRRPEGRLLAPTRGFPSVTSRLGIAA